MLTLTFVATPGSIGASTAALGAALALSLSGGDELNARSRTVSLFSDRPHPHALRTDFVTARRLEYLAGSSGSAIAVFDASDTLRPRTPAEVREIAALMTGPTIWFPIVSRAPQAKEFLRALPVRPAVPLCTERPAQNDAARHLPPLDDLCRQVLEDGVEFLGYTPATGLRRWTQAWLDLLGPIITEAERAEALYR